MNKDELDALYPLPDGYYWAVYDPNLPIYDRLPVAIRRKPRYERDHAWFCVWFASMDKSIRFDVPNGEGEQHFCYTTEAEAPAIIWAKFMFDFIT